MKSIAAMSWAERSTLAAPLFEKFPGGRRKVIEIFRSYPWQIARKYYICFGEDVVEDCAGAGTLGMIACVDRYNLGMGVPFHDFAFLRTRGAMRDEFRKLDRVSRMTRLRMRDVRSAIVRLNAKLGRMPDNDEVADELKLPVENVRASRYLVDNTVVVSTSALPEEVAEELELRAWFARQSTVHIEPFADEFEAKTRDDILAAVASLPAREREVILRSVMGDEPLRVVGDSLGRSESLMSRAKTSALNRLRPILLANPYIAERFAKSA